MQEAAAVALALNMEHTLCFAAGESHASGSNAEAAQSQELRALAIGLLASMAHSTPRCHAELLAADGPAIFLGLLCEQVGINTVLDTHQAHACIATFVWPMTQTSQRSRQAAWV